MKKNLMLLAAALFAFGMASCTDEPIVVDGGNTEITTPRVKSVADLIGTQWVYNMEDMVFVDEMGDTVGYVPLSDLEFGLNFDENYAHFTFPEEVMVISAGTDDDGMPTMEELQEIAYAYTYDPGTQTGALTGEAYDDNGEVQTVQIPFSYDVATDGILINLQVLVDEDGNPLNIQLVYHRV